MATKSTSKSAARPKKAAPRRAGSKSDATRTKIIAAFETVLRKGGVEAVGINAIAKQADIGKPLIYRYFGDLDGLIKAWAQQQQLWADDETVAAKALPATAADKMNTLRKSSVTMATRMRSQPQLLQLLASDLTGRSHLSKSLAALKKDLGKHHGALYANDELYANPDMIAALLVLYAAGMYLAHRTVGDPIFNGINLDTDAGWAQAMGLLERVFDNTVTAMKSKDRAKS